jgi:NhaA family Na+:H+ antiporter
VDSPKPYPLEHLFGRIRSPLEQFLRRTSAGGIVLVAATAVALALATALGQDAVHDFWAQRVSGGTSGFYLDLTLHEWVNDALMAIFFLVVGLELKREMLVGELASIRDAALPVLAAAGGMAVPAAIYIAFNAETASAHGWGIPMATDIAFAVGILVMLGRRAPRNLVVFLMALAIADDLGAVLVIAFFYTHQLSSYALSISTVIYALLWLMNRAGVRNPLPYGVVGVMLWYTVHLSGIHATVAGVLLATVIPVRPFFTPAQFEQRMDNLLKALRSDRRDLSTPDDPLTNRRMAEIAEAVERSARAVQSPLQRIEHNLNPWVTFVVLPIFALSNAGIDLASVKWAEAFTERTTLGIVLGLALGKFVGIAGASWLGVMLRIGRLPAGVRWSHVLGASWLGGIGFTMSLFIAQLAFDDERLVEQAKLGILVASVVSAAIGMAWLYVADARKPKPS